MSCGQRPLRACFAAVAQGQNSSHPCGCSERASDTNSAPPALQVLESREGDAKRLSELVQLVQTRGSSGKPDAGSERVIHADIRRSMLGCVPVGQSESQRCQVLLKERLLIVSCHYECWRRQACPGCLRASSQCGGVVPAWWELGLGG